MKCLEKISIPIFILTIVILAAFVLVLRAQDTTMPVQTGTISLTSANLQPQVFTTNDLWLEVVGVSNTTAYLVIHIPWNETNGVYDLFGTTNLSANVPGLNVTNWVWLTRTTAWQMNIAMANLWPDMGFFILGTMLDSDGDGLTDAYEKLVSHTDPNSPLTITTQPANQWVIQGSNATFSVTAVGGALSYQWYFNSAMLGAATNAILILNNVQTNNAGNYYVVVTNMAGSVTSSNAFLTINVPPSAIPGLKLWLEANAGITTNAAAQISTWADQSSNTNNATQSNTNYQPLYVTDALNGLPVVRFYGSNYFNLPNTLFSGTTQAEAFVVLKAAADVSPSLPRPLWHFGGSGYTGIAYPDSSGNITDDFGSTSFYTLGNPEQPLDQYHVYEVAGQTNYWAAWLNGKVQSTTTNNTYGTNGSPTLGYSSPGGYYFAGDVVEVLVFNRVLSVDDRDTVNGYLSLKYGLMTVPTMPTNLVATVVSASQVSLTWSFSLGTVSTVFKIERKMEVGGGYTQVATVRDATSYMDTNLAADTQYYYQVKASNCAGDSGYSNEADATTQASGADIPLGSLRLWLKADSGVKLQSTNKNVITWFDQSGNGNDANQGIIAAKQPFYVTNAFNGLPVVRFYGSNYFNLPNTLFSGTTQAEAFVVLKAAADVSPSLPRPLWRLGVSGYTSLAYPDSNGNIVDDFGSTSFYTVGNPAQPLDQCHVYEVASQGGNWSAWINGVLQSSPTNNTYGINTSPALGLGNYGYYFAGDVAEVLIFNRTLNASERDTVNGYLNLKYGLVPVVSITSPTNNAIVAAGNIVLMANATEASGGTIKQVQFFQGANSIGVSTTLPYSVTWGNVPAGTYALTGQATGVNGLTSTSSVVNITVDLPPTVLITSPNNNEDLGIAPVNVTVNATASDNVGISQVKFFQGTNSLFIATDSPYSFVWNGVPAGNYSLTAVALGNDGLSTTSSVVNVLVEIDSDNDGLGNEQEYLYGTNPNISGTFGIWISVPGGGLIP